MATPKSPGKTLRNGPPTETASSTVAEGAAVTLDRRTGAPDRRGPDAPERRSGFDRRRGPGKRRTDYRRAAEEGHMNEEQLAFLLAMEEYKRVNNRPFPSLTETLDVLLYLGYRKVATVGEFKLTKGRQGDVEGAADGEPD